MAGGIPRTYMAGGIPFDYEEHFDPISAFILILVSVFSFRSDHSVSAFYPHPFTSVTGFILDKLRV